LNYILFQDSTQYGCEIRDRYDHSHLELWRYEVMNRWGRLCLNQLRTVGFTQFQCQIQNKVNKNILCEFYIYEVLQCELRRTTRDRRLIQVEVLHGQL